MLALDADKATINVDRLLRLPGTINIPNKKKRERGRQPLAASIMELSDRVFTLADFRSVDADAAPSTRSSKRQGTQARREDVQRLGPPADLEPWGASGRASCRARVCEYV